MDGHVVLIGLSGSGKSAVGALLAQMLARPLYDTDRMVAQRVGRPVPALLRDDPAAFRALEEHIVAAACGAPAGVIATGGGVVLSAHSRAMLRAGNRVVWLRAPVSVLAARLAGGEERPLLGGDTVARLTTLATERGPLYASCAHVTIDTEELSCADVAQRISTLLVDGMASELVTEPAPERTDKPVPEHADGMAPERADGTAPHA